MKISSFSKNTLFLFVMVLIIASCNTNHNEAQKPNIIFILADDLGYGDLSCYGQTRFQTPNIDKMASEGIKFTNFYAGSTVCAPSRNSIMTGQHTGHCTIRGNGIGNMRIPLDTKDTTVAMLLQKNGYHTGLVGKWGLGEPESEALPNQKGFDYFFGYLNQKNAHKYYPEYVWENNKKYDIHQNENDKREINIHNLFTEKSLDFLVENKDNPFFLFLSYTAPHAEIVATNEALEKYKGKYKEVTFEGSLEYPKNNFPRASYAAMVHQLDGDVGKIQHLIDSLGLGKKTLLIFSSDNGPEAGGKHGCDPEFFNSTGNLKGVKRSLYEGGIRVPFIAKWEGQIQPSQISNDLGAMWDLLPTFCDVANVKHNQNLDGISLLPAFRNNQNNIKKHDFLYWEFHRPGMESTLACRQNNWKAVYFFGQDRVELYNLETDLFEQNDIAASHPEKAKELKLLMLSERSESEYWNLTSEKTYSQLEGQIW